MGIDTAANDSSTHADRIVRQPNIQHDRKVRHRLRAETILRRRRQRYVRQRVVEHTNEIASLVVESGVEFAESAARRIAERTAELAQERSLLRTLVDNIPDYIYVKDQQGRYLLANRAYLLSLRMYDPDDLIAKTDLDIYPDIVGANFHQADLAVLSSMQPMMGVEERRAGLGGGDIWVSATKVPLIGVTGEPIGVVGIAHDITDRKRMEDGLRKALESEQELSELKTRFVSMASHEFRTPLATILASTETLRNYRDQLDDEKIEARLDKIKAQVRHMTGIMEDVLLLARGQAGKALFNPESSNLASLLRETLYDFSSPGEPDLRHQLVTTINCLPQQTVMIDRGLFRKVVNNMLSNAFKYSPDGSTVRLSLDCHLSDPAAPHVVTLTISDQGIGIPEEDQRYIFEPFHRAKNVGATSGTGLGLVVAKQSVELHGGSIEFASKVGEGTTFVIRFPVDRSGYTAVQASPRT